MATETGPQRIVARVEVGGKVSNRKGVSLPDTVIPLAALAAKDIADLEAALDAGIDWVALSFIQRPEDIAEAKKITRGRAAVMAKIEKPQAVARLDDILDLADALMVARGDLGVEMPLEKRPRRAEGHDARLPASRQAGGGRDPDAGIDDREPGADPRRGLRRRHRDLRRRRRGDAVGGIGSGAISGRGGGDHEPHRRASGKRLELPVDAARAAHRAGAHRGRRHRGRGAASRRDARPRRHRLLDLFGLDRLAGIARAAAMSRSSRFRRSSPPAANCRSSGASTA